jgi:hypothetical protein
VASWIVNLRSGHSGKLRLQKRPVEEQKAILESGQLHQTSFELSLNIVDFQSHCKNLYVSRLE